MGVNHDSPVRIGDAKLFKVQAVHVCLPAHGNQNVVRADFNLFPRLFLTVKHVSAVIILGKLFHGCAEDKIGPLSLHFLHDFCNIFLRIGFQGRASGGDDVHLAAQTQCD